MVECFAYNEKVIGSNPILFKKIYVVVVEETGAMNLDNMLKIRHNWKRWEHTSRKKKLFHPVTKEQLDFSVLTAKTTTNKVLVNNIKTHQYILLSYIVHSIDASVIQFFVLEMFKQHTWIYNIYYLHYFT